MCKFDFCCAAMHDLRRVVIACIGNFSWMPLYIRRSYGSFQHGALFPSNPKKKNRPQEFTLHRAVEKLRVFYQVMLLGSKPMGSNQGSLGVTARFMGPHLLGCFGSLRPSENVKIIHLFVMFKEDIVSQNPI